MWVAFFVSFLISSSVCDFSSLEDSSSDRSDNEVNNDNEAKIVDQVMQLLTQSENDESSSDPEYEDLKADLYAYLTAFGTMKADLRAVDETSLRKSLKSTPCWKLGGICVDFKLCSHENYLTQVPGCRNKREVCCFEWNKFRVRDFEAQGIYAAGLPWKANAIPFGGKGVILKGEKTKDVSPVEMLEGRYSTMLPPIFRRVNRRGRSLRANKRRRNRKRE